MALAAAEHHSAAKSCPRLGTEHCQGSEAAGSPERFRAAGGRGAVTDGYVAAPVPLLVVASLAGGDNGDATTVSYLLSVALAKKKEEEAKERRRPRRKAKFEEKMLP